MTVFSVRLELNHSETFFFLSRWRSSPVVTVSISLIGRLGPYDMGYSNVDWLRSGQALHLIGQEGVLDDRAVMVAVRM